MVGEGALLGALGYAAIGRETTFGTYLTATAAIDFLSSSIKTIKPNKILEQVSRSRTHARNVQMGKTIEGDLEYYYYPDNDACNFILQNAFGGTVTSITAPSDTAGAGAFQHTFEIGNMDQSFPSLCINLRKGPSTGGKVFEYSGVRVNETTFTAELDDALKVSTSFMAKDSTQTSNDVESALTIAAFEPMSFVNGRISIELLDASLTTTSFIHVQSVEIGISNSLKGDSESRRIGSDVLAVLPPGIASFVFNATLRYDTTTLYDAMISGTQLSAEIQFEGSTISGSQRRRGITMHMPKLIVNEGGDPEISGPDEILTSQVEFHVLRDESSAGGFAIQAIVINTTSSYV